MGWLFAMHELDTEKAIIVLGYTLNQDGTLPEILMARLLKAYSIYQPGMPIILSGNRPPLQFCPNRCESISEAQAMTKFFIDKKFDEADLYLEEFSTTTFLNAFYSRLVHIDPMKIRSVCIVSNSFHMPLVRYCFNLVFGSNIQLEFIEANNHGLNEHELMSLNQIIKIMTEKIYPILFAHIRAGDIKALYQLVHEASMNHASPVRLQFEASLREMFSLPATTSFKGII